MRKKKIKKGLALFLAVVMLATSSTEIPAFAESIQDSEIPQEETFSENEMIPDSELISENETIPDSELVSENTIIPDLEPVSENETVSGEKLVSENQTVSEDTVSPNELMTGTLNSINIPIEGVTAQPGSYNADITVSVNSTDYSAYDFYVLYSDTEANLPLEDEISNIYSDKWNYAREEDNEKDYGDNKQTIYFKPQGFHPSATYYYQLFYGENGTYYKITNAASFTTQAAITESKVSFTDFTVKEAGYTKAKVAFQLVNPDNEYIVNQNIFITDGTNPSYATEMYDEENNLIPGMYQGTVFLGKDQSKEFKLEAEVYTGDLVKTPVTAAPITITAKSSADLKTTCTPTSFVNSAVMRIKLNPYYRVDSYNMNLKLDYTTVNGTDSETKSVTASENSIQIKNLTENTNYTYKLSVYDDNSNTNLLTSCTGIFQTTQDTEYSKSEFDEQIFSKIIGQLNLSTDITTIKQSQLEEITELKITSEDVVTPVLSTPVLSLKGVNHLVNLTELEITGQNLSAASEIQNLTSLQRINLAGNKLTEMPDLSNLDQISSSWRLDFNYNFIPSSSITEAKLPASIVEKGDWITETLRSQMENTTQCITSDTYYAIGEKHPFFLEAQNFPVKRKNTLTVTVNGIEKSSEIESSNGAYYYSFPDLEIAAGTYPVAMKLMDCYGKTQWEETRSVIFAGDEAVIEDVYADASDKELSVTGYIPGTSKAKEIQLKNAEGTVVGKDRYTNSYSNKYHDSRYDGIFSKIYEFNENDIKWSRMQINSTVRFSKSLTAGDYNLVFIMEDGKEYSFTNIVHISAKAVIAEINTSGYRENQKNDNAGAYYYLDLRGVNIDPQKVWPVIKAKDGTVISEKSSVAYIGNSTYQYQLKKVEVDTYWKDQSTLHVTVGSESGYEFVDGRKNKTITYYEQSDHVRSEYYNYRSSVNKYRVCFDSNVTDGTKVSIKLYSDSKYSTQLAVTEGTVTNRWANLNLKDLEGNEFVPDRDKYYYKKIVYTENYKGTENYSSKITWYGVNSNSSSSMSYQLNSDDAIRTSDSASIDCDITLPNQTDKTLTYEAYLDKTSNSKLGDAVLLTAEETTYNGKKCVKLTGKRTGTQLSSGNYYLNVYCNNTLVAKPKIAVYNNDLFYIESNYAYGNSNGDYGVYIESNQLKGEYSKVYHSKVSDADALQLVKDSYTLEVHDLLGNEINGWSVKSASYSNAYIRITLTGIPADYLGCYIKILSKTKTNKEGYTLDGTDSTVYYESQTYNVDPRYGYYATESTASLRFQTSTERHDEKTSWSSYDSIDIDERSGMLPVTVNFYKIGDNTPTKTLKIKKAGKHQFTSSELSGISSTEVYFMTAESEDRKQGDNETGYVGVITSSVDVPEADITLSLDQTSISMQEGNTVKLSATPSATTEETLFWSSSNQKVATVDNGTVTAIGAGTAIITASLSGGASAKCQIIVTGKSAADAVDLAGTTVKAIKKQIYTGQMLTPKLTVKNGKDTLVENADYILSYRNNTNAGINTAVAVIYGIGAYKGTKEITFTIAPKAIKSVMMETYDMIATGTALSPAVIIMDNGKRLTEGVDYSITGLKNNQKKGTGKFIIQGINNYTGKKSGSFKIYPANTKILTGLSITADMPESGYTYDGKKKMPVLTVKDSSGAVLQIKKDYTVSYKNNVNAGTAIAIVKGKGSNKGKKNYYFKIKALDASTETSVADITAVNYTGGAVNPKVIVKNKAGKKLRLNKDYTLTYSNNYQASTTTKAGTATVVITGKGNYSGTTSKDFLINKIAFGKGFKVKELKTQAYTGEALTPSFKLYYKKRLLKQDQDYTVTYKNNVNVGKGEIVITATENSSFTGSMTKTFKIK